MHQIFDEKSCFNSSRSVYKLEGTLYQIAQNDEENYNFLIINNNNNLNYKILIIVNKLLLIINIIIIILSLL